MTRGIVRTGAAWIAIRPGAAAKAPLGTLHPAPGIGAAIAWDQRAEQGRQLTCTARRLEGEHSPDGGGNHGEPDEAPAVALVNCGPRPHVGLNPALTASLPPRPQGQRRRVEIGDSVFETSELEAGRCQEVLELPADGRWVVGCRKRSHAFADLPRQGGCLDVRLRAGRTKVDAPSG